MSKLLKLQYFEARGEENANALEPSKKYDLLYEFIYGTNEIIFRNKTTQRKYLINVNVIMSYFLNTTKISCGHSGSMFSAA